MFPLHKKMKLSRRNKKREYGIYEFDKKNPKI